MNTWQAAGSHLSSAGADDATPAPHGSLHCYTSAFLVQAQELTQSATLQVDFRHVESFDAELAGLIQQHHYRIELGLRQVTVLTACLPAQADILCTSNPE